MPSRIPVSTLLRRLAEEVIKFPRLTTGQPDHNKVWHGDGELAPECWCPLHTLDDALPLLWAVGGYLQPKDVLAMKPNGEFKSVKHDTTPRSACHAIVEAVSKAKEILKDGESIDWES